MSYVETIACVVVGVWISKAIPRLLVLGIDYLLWLFNLEEKS